MGQSLYILFCLKLVRECLLYCRYILSAACCAVSVFSFVLTPSWLKWLLIESWVSPPASTQSERFSWKSSLLWKRSVHTRTLRVLVLKLCTINSLDHYCERMGTMFFVWTKKYIYEILGFFCAFFLLVSALQWNWFWQWASPADPPEFGRWHHWGQRCQDKGVEGGKMEIGCFSFRVYLKNKS